MNFRLLILNFSGIHNFDTHVAHQIFQIRDILQVLGIQPVITEIKPPIAQIAVSLGINTKELQTNGTVQQFLETSEQQPKLEYPQESH